MSPKPDRPEAGPSELNSPEPFIELMALQRINDDHESSSSSIPEGSEKVERFRSLAAPFPPAEGTMAFGGHVYAQSAWAACQTVEKGFVIHDMSGTWILGGRLDIAFAYTVRHIRDGKLYCTRTVEARQGGRVCFSGVCSFKCPEKETFNHQPAAAQSRYQSVLSGKRPEDYPFSPSVDADWWNQYIAEEGIFERPFPGVDVRKVDMKDYNQTEDVKRDPGKFRQLHFYRLKGSPERDASKTDELQARTQAGEYDNLFACAHMYASDKNSLLLIPRALGHSSFTAMASLSLTVIFHQHGGPLRMNDWHDSSKYGEGESRKWFLQEGWTPSSGDNRAIHESYLWSPDGTLLATTIQNSQLRISSRNERL